MAARSGYWMRNFGVALQSPATKSVTAISERNDVVMAKRSRVRVRYLSSTFFFCLALVYSTPAAIAQNDVGSNQPKPTVERVSLPRSSVESLAEDTRPPSSTLGALRILRDDQLVGGPASTGQIGDILLYNDAVLIIIDDVSRLSEFTRSGGNIIDVDRSPGGNDQLSQIFTCLDQTFPRHLAYQHIAITSSGADGNIAEVTVTGTDSNNPDVVGSTRYVLEKGSSMLRIVTRITNISGATIGDYEIGDCVQWGTVEPYVPAYGFDVLGKTTRSSWIAGIGQQVSYALATLGTQLRAEHGNGWSDIVGGKVRIPKGASVTYERMLLVGDGDTESIFQTMLRESEGEAEVYQGRVRESASGQPIVGARVEARVLPGLRWMGFAVTNHQGQFQLALPPNEYSVQVSHAEHGTETVDRVDLTHGAKPPALVVLPTAATLQVSVVDQDQKPMPFRMTVEGQNGTPDPYFGHRSKGPGALNLLYSRKGDASCRLPPGEYRLTLSRGIEYSIDQRTVRLVGGNTQSIHATLVHEVDTGGYLAADFDQRTLRSPDSWARLEDVITANLAEGVEIVAITDHNYITDGLPILQMLELESRLKLIPGQSLYHARTGSIATFPVEPNPGRPGNGALTPPTASPATFFDGLREKGVARVIMLRDPRNVATGYFETLGLDPYTGIPTDPSFDFGFNALEVLSGKRFKAGSLVLRDWFMLLNKGYAFTALGNSASATIATQERGYPRNYLNLYSDHPGRLSDQDIVSVVRDRRDVLVTNGPFISVSANGNGRIGSLVALRKPGAAQASRLHVAIEVQGARWIHVNDIELIANGEVIRRFRATDPDGIVKFREEIELQPLRDTWYVVVARGSRSMEPVVPRYKGTTILPFAFTNPIWVDVDGNLRFEPLFPPSEREKGYIEVPFERLN